MNKNALLLKLFSLYTLLMAVLTGMAVGHVISEKLFNASAYVSHWPVPQEASDISVFVIFVYWLASSTGQSFTTLLTFWLLSAALLKRMKWKWAILGGGIWWIFYGGTTTAMHSLS